MTEIRGKIRICGRWVWRIWVCPPSQDVVATPMSKCHGQCLTWGHVIFRLWLKKCICALSMRLYMFNGMWQSAPPDLCFVRNYRLKTLSTLHVLNELLEQRSLVQNALKWSIVAWIWWSWGFGRIADKTVAYWSKTAFETAAHVSLRVTLL